MGDIRPLLPGNGCDAQQEIIERVAGEKIAFRRALGIGTVLQQQGNGRARAAHGIER